MDVCEPKLLVLPHLCNRGGGSQLVQMEDDGYTA